MRLHERVEHRAVRLVHRVAREIAEPVVVLPVKLDLTLSGRQRHAQEGLERAPAPGEHRVHRVQAPRQLRRDRQHAVAAAAAAPGGIAREPAGEGQQRRLKHAQKFRSPRPELQRVPRAGVHPGGVFECTQVIVVIRLLRTLEQGQRLDPGRRHRQKRRG